MNQATFRKPVISVAISSVKHKGNNFQSIVIQGNARLQRKITVTLLARTFHRHPAGFIDITVSSQLPVI